MSNLPAPDISLKALGKLAGPIFVANIAVILSGTIDTIMAGQLGKDHLAAIGLGLAATLLVYLSLVGILQSLSPIAGHHFGANKYTLVGDEVQQNLWLGFFLSFIGMPLLLTTDLWINMGGVSGEVAHMARVYLWWTGLSIPFCFWGRTFISVNSAISRPRLTMYVSLLMLALKAPLNAIFMYGWLGLPEMGGAGAGVSFALLNVLGFFCYYAIWRWDKPIRKFHALRFNWPRWDLIKEQLRVGVPIGLSSFFEVSSFTLMAIFVSRLGTEYMSAHQIVSNVTSMLYMIPLSMGIATSVLVAQNLGATWPSLANVIMKRSLVVTIIIAVVLVTSLYFGRSTLVALYSSDDSVRKVAASLLISACIYHVFDSIQCVSGFALRGYRVTKLPMVIYGVLLWGCGLGGGYFLGFHGEIFGGPYGVYGFWGATAFALTITGIAIGSMALWIGKQRTKDDPHSPAEIEQAIANAKLW